MVFMPPQHGKSELVSRRLPAFLLGRNPDQRIAVCSYEQGLASQFNRKVQRIIESPAYQQIFPATKLAGNKVPRSGMIRTSSEFEIFGREGSLVSVGVMTGLTGRPVDIGIIDDPVKDAGQAYSERYRDRVWDWYNNVFFTRLHDDARILLTMTRWHEDDLAGRIIKSIEETKEHWDFVVFPAVKEGPKTETDQREEGQALWPGRHSIERLNVIRKTSNRVFTSLYQQRPAPEEGALIKIAWFNYFVLDDLKRRIFEEQTDLVWDFTIDPAYTEEQDNDPTAIMAYARKYNNLYIREVATVRLGMPELLKFIPQFVQRNEGSRESWIYIEPKASGISVAQMMKANTGLNIIIDKAPTLDKITRTSKCTPFMESGRVFLLLDAPWLEPYLYELRMFPNAQHDDQVDVTTMAIDKYETQESQIYGIETI